MEGSGFVSCAWNLFAFIAKLVDFVLISIKNMIFQVRENVRTSLFLCRAFVVFALQSFIAMIAYIGYAVCCMFDDYPIPLRIFGFIFDVAIAVSPITISTMIVTVHAQLREKFTKALFRAEITPSKPKVMDLVDFDGKKLAVKVRDCLERPLL